MAWLSGIRARVKTALLLIVLLLAVILNNRWERSNIEDWDASFSSIYDDRLVPEKYVFELTDQIYRKRLLWSEAALPDRMSSSDRVDAIQAALRKHDVTIDALVKGFEATQLVDAEGRALRGFKTRIAACRELEARWLAAPSEEMHAALVIEFDHALSHLSQLSRIQEQVGQDLKKGSKSRLASSSVLFQLEMGLLIVMGFLIQLLVPQRKSSEALPPVVAQRLRDARKSQNSQLH